MISECSKCGDIKDIIEGICYDCWRILKGLN